MRLRFHSSLFVASFGLALGCSRQVEPAHPLSGEVIERESDQPALVGRSGAAPERAERRRVGDLLVHRFHGAFRKDALVLHEEVVAREGDALVVDYTLEDGDKKDRLRVRIGARSERIVSVHRLAGEEEIPATLADYDAFLGRTTFVPDQNAGALASNTETCLVGPQEVDCKISRFKVYVQDREALLTVRHSDAVGRDIAGEVTALDGTILYHAELVEMRRGEPVEGAGAESDAASAALDAVR